MAIASRLTIWADRIDRLNTGIGRAAAWLALFIVLVQFAVVVLRYLFGIGSIWLKESILYGSRRVVHARRRLDVARGRPCPRRYFLCRRGAADRRPGSILPARFLLLFPFTLALLWYLAALCRALLGDPRAFARDQRIAARLPAEKPDPALCAAAGVARRRAGDPRGERASRKAR